MSELCPAHKAADAAWLGFIGSPAARAFHGINLVSIGNPTPAQVAEARKARADAVYDMVRNQRAMIAEFCATGRGCDEAPTPPSTTPTKETS